MFISFTRRREYPVQKDILAWLHVGWTWVSQWAPHARLTRKGIISTIPSSYTKPFLLDPSWSANDNDKTVATLLYLGREEAVYKLFAIIPFLQPKAIFTSTQTCSTLYQLYPLTYFYILPEPIPEIDYLGAAEVIRQIPLPLAAVASPIIQQTRQQINEIGVLLSFHISLHYLLTRTHFDQTQMTHLRQIILEVAQEPTSTLYSYLSTAIIAHRWGADFIGREYIPFYNLFRLHKYYISTFLGTREELLRRI